MKKEQIEQLINAVMERLIVSTRNVSANDFTFIFK